MIQLEQVRPLPGAHSRRRSRIAPPAPSTSGHFRKLVGWLEAQALFVAALAGVAIVSLGRIPDHLNQDGWLALVAGRYVAAHGIPQHDTLTVMTHGVRWIDQQWLAQLGIYGLQQLGGLALYSLAYVTLTIAGLGIAVAAARRLGGAERHVLWLFPVAGFLYFAGSFQIRTQGFVYPLFAATLWLLAREARGNEESNRAYLVFPLLVLWGNLHGSATMGAGLAVMYGITLLVRDLRSWRGWTNWRAWRGIRRRTIAFIVAPILCLFITPYGVAIVDYYHATLLNPAFGKLITEWQPITSIAVLAVPFFALAFATIWLLGRCGRRAPLFYHLSLMVLAAGAVLAVRNITWFALAAAMLVPSLISRAVSAHPTTPRRPALNLGLAGLSLLALVGLVIAVAAKPASWFERSYDQRAVRTVATVLKQHPGARIFAVERFGDWLLWHDPALAGHIAYDTRFELLTARQLLAIASVSHAGTGRGNILARYGALVLGPAHKPGTSGLLDRSGTHLILQGRGVDVATTSGL